MTPTRLLDLRWTLDDSWSTR